MRAGKVFVFSGPSGVGKDTLLDLLAEQVDGFEKCVTATTRAPRSQEVNQKDYHFVSREQFLEWECAGLMLETATYNDQLYGTPLFAVRQVTDRGLDVILKIEVQGALKVKSIISDALLVFIQPPSIESLRQRLSDRNTESLDEIERRISIAAIEMQESVHYDYVVTNDELSRAVDDLRCIIVAERLRQVRA